MEEVITAKDAIQRINDGISIVGLTVLGDLHLELLDESARESSSNGPVNLKRCEIRGALVINGVNLTRGLLLDYCRVDSIRFSSVEFGARAKLGQGFSARYIDVRGDLSVDNCAFFNTKVIYRIQRGGLAKEGEYSGIDLAGARIGGSLIISRSGSKEGISSLNVERVSVLGNLTVECEFNQLGCLFADGLSIGLSASITSTLRHCREPEVKVFWMLRRMRVGGEFVLSGHFANRLDFVAANVGGDCSFRIQPSQGSVLEEFDFSAAKVGGDFCISGMQDGKVPIIKLKGVGAQIAQDLSINSLRFVSRPGQKSVNQDDEPRLDIYELSAKNITLSDLVSDIPCVLDAGSVSARLFSLDEIGLGESNNGSQTPLMTFRGRYAAVGGFQASKVVLSELDATGIRVDIKSFEVQDSIIRELLSIQDADLHGYVQLSKVRFGLFSAAGVNCSGRLDVKHLTSEEMILLRRNAEHSARSEADKLLIELADDIPGRTFSETLGLEAMLEVLDKSGHRYTSGDVIDLSDSAWEGVDLTGCVLGRASSETQEGRGLPTKPLIRASRIKVRGVLKIRGDRLSPFEWKFGMFGSQHLDAASISDLGSSVLTLDDSDVGDFVLLEPRPSPISLRGARFAGWGLKPMPALEGLGESESKLDYECAESFHRILNCAPLDISQYLTIEQRLDNEGKGHEADRLHVLWRRRERAQMRKGFPRAISWLHDFFLGYGTKRHRLFGVALLVLGLSSFLVALAYDENTMRVSPERLAALAECGEACAHMSEPELAETMLGKLAHGVGLSVHHGVPIISLPVANEIQAIPGSWIYRLFVTISLLGWIVWPVIIASAIRGLFPKRYLSGA